MGKAFAKLFGKKDMRILMLGLDAAGKTSILPLACSVHVYSVSLVKSSGQECIRLFRAFNFRCSACGRKYFNGENFPIYGMYNNTHGSIASACVCSIC